MNDITFEQDLLICMNKTSFHISNYSSAVERKLLALKLFKVNPYNRYMNITDLGRKTVEVLAEIAKNYDEAQIIDELRVSAKE